MLPVHSILTALSLTLVSVRGNPADSGGNTVGTVQQQGGITITSSGGWLEAGFARWSNMADATGYSVYCKPATGADTTYAKVPAELVRGTRADIPGLPGKQSYDIKVVPVVGGVEATAKSSVVRIETQAHDRSGFAFDKRSPRGALGTSGGYNPDGAADPAATILYISEATKDSVQMTVVKGSKSTTATGLVAIQDARSKAKNPAPLIVRFLGTVTPPAGLDADRLKMMQLKDSGNVTYEGIGPDAGLDGWGLDFQRCSNVVVRNLSFKGQPEDQLSFQSNCLNLWIHNNDHSPGKGLAGGESDKVAGDGTLDIKSGSGWVSVDYNHYQGTQKTSGVGFGKDTTALMMTFHHNFYDICGSRMPRISYVSMHVYNSYFKEAQVYCIAAAHGCSAFIENNYFEKCARPMIIASQGHDLDSSGQSTLSKNDGGAIKAQGNFMDAFSADPTRFDPAIDASPGPAVKGGAVYNNFHAGFGSDYSYTLDTPEDAKAKVLRFAGRMTDNAL